MTTFGSLDFGGASVQIAFVPTATSILAGIFPMHFGGSVSGPIHLYSHSYNHFGMVNAFQRATAVLLSEAKNGSKGTHSFKVNHPCLPTGMTWKVNDGEFGVSTTSLKPERKHGPIELVGSSDHLKCRQITKSLFDKETPCFLEPCPMLGVYQPFLNGSKFVIFESYDYLLEWEVLPLVRQGMPLLKALKFQLPKICALSADKQVELFGKDKMGHGPVCWLATWMVAMLEDGLGFHESGIPEVQVRPMCCDHTIGQATYEVNFFPYRVSATSSTVTHPTQFLLKGSSLSSFSVFSALIGGLLALAVSHVVSTMQQSSGRNLQFREPLMVA